MKIEAKDMTFGVEIECYIPNSAIMMAGWTVGQYHHGKQIPNLPTGWNAQADGSLYNGVPRTRPATEATYDNWVPVEVVSPVLKGIEGLNQVREVIAKIKAMGGRVTKSCGFHVHVGFTWGAKELARLVCLVAAHETALYAITGTKRRERGQYCNSVKRHDGLKRIGETGRIDDGVSRYHILNLANLARGRFQAVEFRVFGGSLNIVKIEAYIQVAIATVQKAVCSTKKVEWDGAEVSTSCGLYREGQPGVTATNKLIHYFGWFANGKNFGALKDTTKNRAQLRRMAEKYDRAS